MLLEVTNLTIDFFKEASVHRAVKGISYSLEAGECLGIAGESGSGKTISSLALMRLMPSTATVTDGEIWFHETQPPVRTGTGGGLGLTEQRVDITKLPDNEIRKIRGNKIAMVFQEPLTSLNPVITCGKQVMEAILLHQDVSKTESRNRTIELFKKVKLPRPEAIIDSYPHQLSGGQKQRVMIAMAMSCQPAVLIADEPTTALDVTVQKAILELMKELQEENNMSIIFISHDLGVMAEIAEKVAIMYRGEIVEQGNILDIFSNPTHPYTKGLLACRPPTDKRMYYLPTVSDFMEQVPPQTPKGALSELKFEKQPSQRNAQSPFRGLGLTNDRNLINSESREKSHKELYSKEPILKVDNLIKHFPIRSTGFSFVKPNYVKAVDDISFNIFPGETLGVVGESGSGKTTVGRTLLRLIEPSSGTITFKGQDITKLKTSELRPFRKKMQIIFQDPYSSLNPHITIGESIIEPMRVHNIGNSDTERKKKALELLERVNMRPNQYNLYPHEFSGGQRQRICIARAIALNPEFIVCDECISSLDVSVQAQVINLLSELKRDFGFTYMFISHDISVVKFISDRMMVLYNGKIEELGDADEVYFNPQKEYTKKLIEALPKGRVEDIKLSRHSSICKEPPHKLK